MLSFSSCPEKSEIRREALDQSVYYATSITVPHFRLNISVAVNPRLSKLKKLESVVDRFIY